MRPRHTAEKGARARAPSRTASRPLVRAGGFPAALSTLCTEASDLLAQRAGVSYVPLPHQRLETRRNSKGCSLTPFLAKTFHPQLAQSFDLRPAANERKSVAWIGPPLLPREGGGKRSHLLF